MTENNLAVSVLIVDDNPANLLALEAALAGMDVTIVTATSGTAALHQLLEQDFAVVLLDVNMPIMDGFETAKLIRSRPRSEHLPIVFITAERISDASKLQGYELGAVDYLLSPVLPQILRAKVATFADLYRLRQQLAISEAQFRQRTNSLPQLVWTCQPDGQCDYLSERWLAFTGVAESLQLGFGWLEQLHPDDRAPTVAAWQAAVDSGTDFHAEFRIRRHDGEYRWFDTRAIRVTGIKGEAEKWFGSNTDITERRENEQKLRVALAEKEVMMREIHHRVKNNLQMMSALLELQAGYVQDEQVQNYFKDSQRRILAMAMVHEQLYHTDDMAKIDFVVYLNTLLDSLRGQYEERSKQVAIRIDADVCVLPVDTAIPCGLVLSELISNAMKHAYPNGRCGELRIKLDCASPEKIVLEVADDGVGLPPGFDVQHSKSFGLWLISLMVEKQMHGKLKIESNNGTRVVCEIGVSK